MVQVPKLDHSFLVELGLGHLDEGKQQFLLKRIYELFALRVGSIVSNSLTNAQRDAFERLIEQDPESAHSYLERTIPNYAMVAHSELNYIARALAQSVRRGAVAIGDAKAREHVDG
jgi:hypothetical protein